MRLYMHRGERDERGAIGIMVALMSIMLMGIAALGVDLGSLVIQKRDLQKQTDFSALAGAAGNDLPVTAGGLSCNYGVAPKPGDQAVVDAASQLLGQPFSTSPSLAVTTLASELTNCTISDGEAGYGTFVYNVSCSGGICLTANKNQLSIISPRKQVNFGFARILGINSGWVKGQATVEIKSPTQKTLPLYIAQSCSWGQQTIAQPANGKASSGVNLDSPNDKNPYLTETGITISPVSTATPQTVTQGSTTSTVTVAGANLDQVTQIGFFRSVPSPGTPPFPITVAASSFTNKSTTSFTVLIPSSVTSVPDVWYVRVLGPNKGNGNPQPEWTPIVDSGNNDPASNLIAYPFVVGSASLTCSQGSNSGNFGTLNLFNTTSSAPSGAADNIAYNIAQGLQYGLAPYPTIKLTPSAYTCVNGQDGVAITWPTQSVPTVGDGTNCVGTKTGLDSNAAQEGFIDGINGKFKGLLAYDSSDPQRNSSTFCPNNYPVGTTHLGTSPTSVRINNDTLSCFFTNGTVTVGDVSSQTYAGPAVISQSIYSSPRFVLVPVLGVTPLNGSSDNYEVVDFRPGFITDEASTGVRTTTPTADNGFTWSTNGNSKSVQAVNVVFLNPAALPEPPLDPTGHYIPYVGSGRKVAQLVD